MKNEVAMVASIITHHFFKGISRVHWAEGPIRIHELIVECAEEFVMTYAYVEDWEEYLKDSEIDDWEVQICTFVKKHFKF